MFEVRFEHFEGAIDRFSRFFIDPLFNAEATYREMNAVSSENDKSVNLGVGSIWNETCFKKNTEIFKMICGEITNYWNPPPTPIIPITNSQQETLQLSIKPTFGRRYLSFMIDTIAPMWWNWSFMVEVRKKRWKKLLERLFSLLELDSIDKLEEYAVNYFSEIPNKQPSPS